MRCKQFQKAPNQHVKAKIFSATKYFDPLSQIVHCQKLITLFQVERLSEIIPTTCLAKNVITFWRAETPTNNAIPPYNSKIELEKTKFVDFNTPSISICLSRVHITQNASRRVDAFNFKMNFRKVVFLCERLFFIHVFTCQNKNLNSVHARKS